MSPRPAVTYPVIRAPGTGHFARPLGPLSPTILLVQARHDDLMRAAARSRVAAEIRRSRGPRRSRLITEPLRRLAGIRPRKAARRLAASH